MEQTLYAVSKGSHHQTAGSRHAWPRGTCVPGHRSHRFLLVDPAVRAAGHLSTSTAGKKRSTVGHGQGIGSEST